MINSSCFEAGEFLGIGFLGRAGEVLPLPRRLPRLCRTLQKVFSLKVRVTYLTT